MQIAIVVSTYNRPEFLRRVLLGYAVQSCRDFEIVVADDGSSAETAVVIERARAEHGLRITHVWHEDRGFRKTVILNRAVLATDADYLIFTDGDCVPRRDLVEVHRSLAKPGRFLAGGYLKLPAEVSDRITPNAIIDGSFANLRWLRAQGWRPGRRALRLARPRLLGKVLDRLTPTAAVFQGNNASTWRDAILAANGFEGEMGWGGLDKELGYRLENAGITGIQIRHRAVVMHLHHDRPYRRREIVSRNEGIIRTVRSSRATRAQRGIAELEPDPSLRVDGRGAPV